jgi:hypothetical protein
LLVNGSSSTRHAYLLTKVAAGHRAIEDRQTTGKVGYWLELSVTGTERIAGDILLARLFDDLSLQGVSLFKLNIV